MKAKLGSLVGLATLCVGSLLVALMGQAGSFLPASDAGTDPSGQPTLQGQELVTACRDTLGSVPSLEVTLRQKVSLFGHHLSGTGTYRQRGEKAAQTHLVLRLSTGAPQPVVFTQTHDGRFIFTSLNSPQIAQQTQVDLQRAAEELRAKEVPADSISISASHGGMGGGLYKLVESLQRDFVFEAPSSVTWGGQQVWVVRGRWRSDLLSKRFRLNESDGGYEELAQQLPEQVPSHVELTIGVDPQLPYFPYRIDFLKVDRVQDRWEWRQVSRLDIGGIRHSMPMSDEQFEFDLSDQVVEDRTDAYVAEQIQLGNELR